MRSLIKKTLLCLLFVCIVCVTCPKLSCFKRMSSKSKGEAVIGTDLKNCKLELFVAFKKKSEHESNPKEIPLENFLYAFLNINEDNFVGRRAYTETTRNYYLDLLCTALDIDIPTLMTPKQFCHQYHKINVCSSTIIRTTEKDCIDVIKEAGCDAHSAGIACFKNLYLLWKKRKISKIFVYGTDRLSDEHLLNAISRGSDNVNSTDDKVLLEDYINDPDYLPLPEEIVFEDFKEKYGDFSEYSAYHDMKEQYYRETNRRRRHKDYSRYQQYREDFINFLENKRKKHDLYQARFRRYGIGDASYQGICEEYDRRRSLAMQFENFYGMYIHGIFKALNQIDASKFKSVTDYCKDIISKQQYN